MPKNYAIVGSFFEKFFKRDPISNKYIFKNIDKLRHFPLQRLLTDKYHFKKHEADMLADFLLPMLRWYPTDRPTAKQMLEHPWLNMPNDYDYKMSDLEFQKFQLKQQTQQQNEEKEAKEAKSATFDLESDHGIGQLVPDDEELNEADDEDNVSLDLISSDSSESLTGKKSAQEEEAEFETNVSFSGGYVPNTDLSRVDKGQGNPQFTGLTVK